MDVHPAPGAREVRVFTVAAIVFCGVVGQAAFFALQAGIARPWSSIATLLSVLAWLACVPWCAWVVLLVTNRKWKWLLLPVVLIAAASLIVEMGAWTTRVEMARKRSHALSAFPVGRPMAQLSLRKLDGTPVGMKGFTGRRVLLNFWRTWCQPCVSELPELEALQRSGSITVVGVSTESAELQQRFLRAYGVNYDLLLGLEKDPTATVEEFPTSVLVGPDGKILFSWVGSITAKEVQEQLDRSDRRSNVPARGNTDEPPTR